MDKYESVMKKLQSTAMQHVPKNGVVLLYGSRARGDANEESDWDVLILLDKDKIVKEDYDNIVYPFYQLGWGINEMISPIIYTKNEWQSNSFMPFYKNVEQDKITIYGA